MNKKEKLVNNLNDLANFCETELKELKKRGKNPPLTIEERILLNKKLSEKILKAFMI